MICIITLADITPIGLCITTQELLEVKRFQQNFCDNLLLRMRDENLHPGISSIKKELNSDLKRKYFDGYKAVIINNLDKIISLITSRYYKIDMKVVEELVKSGKNLIKRIADSNNFDEIFDLAPVFKSQILLPTYNLFLKTLDGKDG